jgi:hypothetical protein
MKFLSKFFYLLILMVTMLIISCGALKNGKSNTPAKVSEKFFQALKNQDYNKAKELGTEHTAKIIGVVQTLSEFGGGLNILRDNKKELMGCEENGNEAVCTYKAFTGPDQKVYLVKEKGHWLVDLRQENKEDKEEKQ